MPLPTTGQLSLLDIRNEFSSALSSSPHKLSEYYAGLVGGPVPAGTYGINGAIPGAGTIRVSDFRGAPQIVITCGSYSGFLPPMGIGAGQAESGYNAAGYGNNAYGTISSNSIQGKTIVTLLTQAVTPPKAMGAVTYWLIFAVAGNQTTWSWNTLTVPDGTIYTPSGSVAGATYDSTYNFTRWYWDTSSIGGENMCGTVIIT